MRTVRKCILIIMEKERTATMAPDTRGRGLCLESSSGCAQRTAAAGPCRRRRQSCWWRPPSHGVCACVCRDLVARMYARVRCCRGGVGAAAEERLSRAPRDQEGSTSYRPVTVLYHATSIGWPWAGSQSFSADIAEDRRNHAALAAIGGAPRLRGGVVGPGGIHQLLHSAAIDPWRRLDVVVTLPGAAPPCRSGRSVPLRPAIHAVRLRRC